MKSLDTKKTQEALVSFIKSSFEKAGFAQAVIALSGGIDSATSTTLAVQALGKEHVHVLLLPYGELNGQGVVDARLVIDWLGIPRDNVTEVNIQPLVDPIIALDPAMDNTRCGNVMARTRMIVLFDQAKKQKALVVGTENKSEHLLGYFTRFGDEASDIEPLRNLYKTQVYELARNLSIPEPILTKKPTAGLWEGQTDEGEFGFSYAEADEILSLLYDEKKSVDDVVSGGFSRGVVEKVLHHVKSNDFKHFLPIVLHN